MGDRYKQTSDCDTGWEMLPNGSVPAEGTAQPWEVREHSLKKDIYAEPAMNDCLLGREGHGKSLPGRKDVST